MSYYGRKSNTTGITGTTGSHRSLASSFSSSKSNNSERHKQILKQLLKEPPNKTCGDCKTATHPRWASWSLGCFICIRCSGIHRSMGTHISKVKSVDLDLWTDEQVEQMVKWGNEKCNYYWESKLPRGYVPDASKIENFIRTKYDLKKWVLSSQIPDPMSMQITNEATDNRGVNLDKTDAKRTTDASRKKSDGGSKSLLDDDFGVFTSHQPLASAGPKEDRQSTSTKHLSNQSSKSSSPATVNDHLNSSLPQISSGSMNSRPDLKKSILSLYSSPSSSSSSFGLPNRSVPGPIDDNPQQSVNLLTHSLSGLNFNSSLPPKGMNTSTQSLNSIYSNSTTKAGPSTKSNVNVSGNSTWTNGSTSALDNEWADVKQNPLAQPNRWNLSATNVSTSPRVKSPPLSTLNTSGLDEDLFKNVWS